MQRTYAVHNDVESYHKTHVRVTLSDTKDMRNLHEWSQLLWG